jgi:pantetheine-phosphate adenylyltransferase
MRREAIYPGSFDPPTVGHMDLIERASRLTDHLVVAVGKNSEKKPFLSVEDRVAVLREITSHLGNVEVECFDGLLIHYAQSRNCRVLVRGLRAITDFDYEFRTAMTNKTLAPDIETLFLIAREEYSFLASSVVRELARYGGDLKPFVPDPVGQLILRKIEEEKNHDAGEASAAS